MQFEQLGLIDEAGSNEQVSRSNSAIFVVRCVLYTSIDDAYILRIWVLLLFPLQ